MPDRRRRILYIQPCAGRCGPNTHLFDLITHLADEFEPVVVFGEEGSHTALFRDGGAAVYCNPAGRNLPRSFNPAIQARYAFQSLRSLPWLRRIIRDEAITLVHTNCEAAYLGALAARLWGIPSIIQVHGLGFASLRAASYGIVYALHSLSQKVIAVSEAVAAQLNRYGLPRRKIAIVPNGVDLSKFHPAAPDPAFRHALGIPADAPLLASIGPLDPRKGHEFLIRACALVKQTFPAVRCMIVGEAAAANDPYLRRLKALAARLGLAENVLFAGARDDMPRVLPSIDVFVQPSLTEAFPIATLEAMAAGKPIVATRVGGLVEQIEHQVNGLLVPPADPTALAEAILLLLANDVLREALGNAARTRSQAFTLGACVRQTREIYRELLQSNGLPAGA